MGLHHSSCSCTGLLSLCLSATALILSLTLSLLIPPPSLSLSPSLCVSAWTAAQFHTQGKMKHSNHWACSQIKGCAKKKKNYLKGNVFVCACQCLRAGRLCICLLLYICVYVCWLVRFGCACLGCSFPV